MSATRVMFLLPNFAGGGAEKVALLLLAGLDRSRIEVELAVVQAAGPLKSLVPAGIPLHDLDRPRLRAAVRPLLALIRRRRPDVVFATHGYVNLMLLLLHGLLPRGTRIAVRESNTPSQRQDQERRGRLMRLAYGRLYPRADRVICQHAGTEREMARDFGVDPARIAALPNPVDIAALRRAAAVPKREAGRGPRFVAAGRLTRQKGFDRLLRIAAHLPAEGRITIFGEGPEAGELAGLAARLELGPRVRLAGFTAELAPWLAGADGLLLPSRWEGLPNVALEALACGTPVVAAPEAGAMAALATEAPAGAVRLAELGDDFAAAALALPENAEAVLRPSLLPERYEAGTVCARFEAILETLCRP